MSILRPPSSASTGAKSSAARMMKPSLAVSTKGEEGNAQRDDVWQRDSDLYGKLKTEKTLRSTVWNTLWLAYGSLGVIYGDIGTSIIYVYSQIFKTITEGGVTLADQSYDELQTDVLGAMSLIFWTLTVIALFKYVLIVLRANDTGEGGTVALYAQLCRTMGISPFGTMRMQDHAQVLAMKSAAQGPVKRPNIGEHRHKCVDSAPVAEAPPPKPKGLPLFKPYEPYWGAAVLEGSYVIKWFRRNRYTQRSLLFLTMIATGLVIGDGVLMPAFSVNSAISGIQQHAAYITEGGIVGISIAVIVVLFFSQRFGTERLAFLFSPIIILWLLANLSIAIYNLSDNGGSIFNALSPYWIYAFFEKHGFRAWQMLGGVMLCVSGTETMFAAMGHFSQPAVSIAFGLFAYPCLILTYLGQGAYLLNNPLDSGTVFWASIPTPIFWPMLVLATLAAIVASQAVITGTFSIIRQATSLGIFPKMRVVHTNSYIEGQIFIPVVNYTLMLLCIAVIAGFGGDNNKLGEAYGVAVMAVMLITTCMVSVIMLVTWQISLIFTIFFYLFYTFIEGVFWSANLYKVPSGGWFPLAVALGVFIIMGVWWAGSYMRRRVLLQSSKQVTAATFFRQLNYTDANPSVHIGSSKSLAMVARSESAVETSYGSAVDLTAPLVSAAGYAAYEDATQQRPPPPPAARMSIMAGRAPIVKGPGKELSERGTAATGIGRASQPPGSGDSSGGGVTKPKPGPPGLLRQSAAPAVRLLNTHSGGYNTTASAPRGRKSADVGGPVAEALEQEEDEKENWAVSAPGPVAEAREEEEEEQESWVVSGPGPVAEAQEEDAEAPVLPPPPAGGPQQQQQQQPGVGGAAALPPPPPRVAVPSASAAMAASTSAGGASPPHSPTHASQPGNNRQLSPIRAVSRTNSGTVTGGQQSALSIAARKAAALQYGTPQQPQAAFPAGVTASPAGSSGQLGLRAERKVTLSLTERPERVLATLSGLGLYYSDSPVGIPPVMRHFLRNVDAMHHVGIILTVRFLPMPIVTPVERLLVRSVTGIPNFYQVVARYGYQDQIDHRFGFVTSVINHIMHKLELKAGLMMEGGEEDDYIHELEGDYVEDETNMAGNANSRGTGLNAIREQQWQEDQQEAAAQEGHGPGQGRKGNTAPLRQVHTSAPGPGAARPDLVSKFSADALERLKITGTMPEASQAAKDSMEAAIALIAAAKEQVVYYLGRAFTRPDERRHNFFHNVTIGGLYRTFEMLAYQDSEAWQIPLDDMVELGMALEI